MRINNNISALNTWRNMGITDLSMSKSLERLSSGLRINRAADDAAGLAVSEKMRGQIKGLNQAIRNAQDGISMIQTAEGALTETHSILARMRELSIQASNGTLDNTDRTKLQSEFGQLITEIGRIANTTEFNGKTLLNGGLGSTVGNFGASLTAANGIQNINSTGAATGLGYTVTVATGTTEITVANAAGTVSETVNYTAAPAGFGTKTLNFTKMGIAIEIGANIANVAATNTFDVTAGQATLQIGANGGQTVDVTIGDMRDTGLAVNGLSIATVTGSDAALIAIDAAIGTVSSQRADLGALQNRIEHTVANLSVASENLTAAESRIRDVDMASEMAAFTRSQILLQAGTAMMAQANQKPQNVLQLLR